MSEHRFLGCRVENCPNCKAVLEELETADGKYMTYYRPLLIKVGKFQPVETTYWDDMAYDHSKFLNDIQYETEEECEDICDRVYLFCSTYPTPLIGFVSPRTIWRLYKEENNIQEE